MKKALKIFLIPFITVIVTFTFMVLKPVPKLCEANTISKKGIVSKIYSTESNDIFFVLNNTDQRFYINRGTDRGLELKSLKEKLMGKPVEIKYPKYWTPLDWNNSIRHIAVIKFNGEIVYTELKNAVGLEQLSSNEL